MRFIFAAIFVIFCSVASAVEPTILVNSATGSDTQASGAGPATALFGAAGVTAADGLSVVLDGTPDLSGVATDGSAVLFMSDTNAGSKNFCKITGVNDGTDTVTVDTAFQALNTDAWAIGGKRASIASTTSKKLFETNSAAGDALPGWSIEMQSGHTETIAATITVRRSGTSTAGRIILRGTSGAATRPILTFSNNGDAFAFNSVINYWTCQDFDMKNTNATKTNSDAFQAVGTNVGHVIRGIKCADSTDKFARFANLNDSSRTVVEGCDIGYTAGAAFISASVTSARISYNYIHNCAAVSVLGVCSNVAITGNIFANNTGDTFSLSTPFNVEIARNTIYASTGDGIEVTGAAVTLLIENNQITDCGGYGLNFSSASQVVERQYGDVQIRGNNTYNNTLGSSSPASISLNDPGLNPGYTNAASFNWAISSATAGMGHPEGVIFGSSTASYPDPGAAQQQPATAANLALPSLGRRWR